MASLTALSNELKIQIIEHISNSPSLPPSDPDSNEDPINPPRKLPQPNHNLFHLSCTNCTFRALTAPFLFHTLILRNTEKSGSSIALLSKGPYASSVRKIEYLAAVPMRPSDAYRDSQDYGEKFTPKSEDLPVAVEDVLSHLNRFEKLEALVVEFPFEEEEYRGGFYHFEENETQQDIVDKEASQGWRAIMTRSYAAIVRNPPGFIRNLELRNLVAKESSAWTTSPWKVFIGSLHHLSLSLRGGDNGVGWHISTLPGYHDFVTSMATHFLHPAVSLTHLSVAATRDGAIGGPINRVAHHINRLAHLPLPPSTMPHLQHLALDYICISSELLQYLRAHTDTLRSVRLYHSFASSGYDGERMAWWEFFDTLIRAQPPMSNVVEFDARPVVTYYASSGNLEEDKLEEEAIMRYAHLHSKYGDIFNSWTEDGAARRTLVEKDNRAYQQWMRVVENN